MFRISSLNIKYFQIIDKLCVFLGSTVNTVEFGLEIVRITVYKSTIQTCVHTNTYNLTCLRCTPISASLLLLSSQLDP